MAKEAADAVKDERPYAGVHILATALLCANGSTEDELELARKILERDPRRDSPREAESIAGAFNRQMDAALESANDSVAEPTRAGRRARLAADLSRAGLVVMDRGTVADLIAVVHELRGRVAELEADGQDLGAELLEDEIELWPGELEEKAAVDAGPCGDECPCASCRPRDYAPASAIEVDVD